MLKASVIGNLGNDPELRYSPSGAPSLRVNVASSFRARTPEGEWEDRTEWVRVIVEKASPHQQATGQIRCDDPALIEWPATDPDLACPEPRDTP